MRVRPLVVASLAADNEFQLFNECLECLGIIFLTGFLAEQI